MNASEPVSRRIASLDQFRGYTVLGMVAVNFVGSNEACHYLLEHHHTFISYADTVMPQFLFAVGFAFRLTFQRRIEVDGAAAAYARMVKRLLGLILISLVLYVVAPRAASWRELVDLGTWGAIQGPLKRDWFQTLTHIAVTSLWILPVIRTGAATRITYMVISAIAHVVVSHVFYFHWVNSPPNGIDGGPLGFLTWTMPAIVGTLACDLFVRHQNRPPVFPMLFWSGLLLALGYGMSCGTRFYDLRETNTATVGEKLAASPVIPSHTAWTAARENMMAGDWTELLAEPPFVPPTHSEGGSNGGNRPWNYWMMSQRAGTLSYLTFASGFSLAVFAAFYILCDVAGFRLGIFRTFGTNALAAYVLHLLVADAVKPFLPRDCPAWYLWSGFAVFLTIVYVLVRSLEKQGVYVKV